MSTYFRPNGKPLDLAKMLGMSIFYSSIQASIGSVELSSKFSIANFCKDKETLDNAIAALHSYMIVAFVWMIATMLVLYSQFGFLGAITGF